MQGKLVCQVLGLADLDPLIDARVAVIKQLTPASEVLSPFLAQSVEVCDYYRVQMVSILDNVILAIPTGILIVLIGQAASAPVMREEEAWHTLEEINPFYSLALIHAAIAGVCLFCWIDLGLLRQ